MLPEFAVGGVAPVSISVVIPCYNAGAFLGQAIESALAQTRPAHEILVVDDGSTDESSAVAARYPVTLLRQLENRGNAAARNHGIRLARGTAVAMLDADDHWAPDHLATLGAMLDAHPGAAVAASAMQVFGDRDHVLPPFFEPDTPRDIFWTAFRACPVGNDATLVRREVLLAHDGYYEEERSAVDADLWFRIARRHPFVCTHRITAYYRRHAGQISHNSDQQLIAFYRHRRRFLDGVQAEDEPSFAADVEERLRRIWRDDARLAWQSRGQRQLATLLDLTPLVSGLGKVEIVHWRIRAVVIPWVERSWDKLPLGVRRELLRFLGRVQPHTANAPVDA